MRSKKPMQPTGYSPYQAPVIKKKKLSFKIPKLPKFPKGLKKWLLYILGFFFFIFLVIYICLGDLRFFANNFLRLGFFQKDYLILLQNNYELRPTGGFVTGYGEMSMTMGIPTGLNFNNVYEIDTDEYVTPPYPHEELLKNEWYEGYTFRDANWNPNFPEATEELIEFYQKKFPKKDVDGIIVVNFSFIENLIDRLGGIELNGELLTKDNLFKKITDNVNDVDRHSEEALSNRKNILGELIKPLASKLIFHPFKAKSTVLEGIANKDIYFWFANDKLQQKVEKKGWANAMTLPKNSDFLGVNLANLGAKKADRYVFTEVNYHVNLQEDAPTATTEVTIRFPNERNIYADDYKGYLRVYIPGAAEMISPVDDLKIEQQGDFKVVGQIVNLKASEAITFIYQYKLPSNVINQDNYHLRVNKQSGDNKHYNIVVENENDHGMQSDNFDTKENLAIWRGNPKNDLDLEVKLLEDITPPYPVEQVFSNLNTISIYWNENISPASGEDLSNYKITDLDITNPSVTDTLEVTKAEVIDGNVTRLELEGVTEQELERYQIQMENIRDFSNNAIEPAPKKITAVQRF